MDITIDDDNNIEIRTFALNFCSVFRTLKLQDIKVMKEKKRENDIANKLVVSAISSFQS